MYYEDLKLRELVKTQNQWLAVFGARVGTFNFPVADASCSEKELEDHGLIVGKMFLGVVEDDRLVGVENFSYIEDTPEM